MKTETAGVPMSEWRWFGRAGHFICADRCLFHLCTAVGDHLISSVGAMPRHDGRKGYEPLGAGPYPFETYVFNLAGSSPCKCGCGMPKPPSMCEIDGRRSMTDAEAIACHFEFCHKYAKAEGRE